MIAFETGRTSVRAWTDDDLPALLAVYGDPEVVRFVGDRRPLDEPRCRRWIEVTRENYATRGYGMYAVVERTSKSTVGFCGIVHPGGQEAAEVKYAFRRDRWRQGFANEVVPALVAHGYGGLALDAMLATVDPANEPSRHVLTRAGLRHETTASNEDGSQTEHWWTRRHNTALLLIDVQANMFDPANPVADADGLLARLSALHAAARRADVPVALVRNDGGPGDPDIPGTPGWELHPSVAPAAGEFVFDKSTCDSFEETPLRAWLDARGVRRVVVAGLQSDWCIRTTIRGALERGFGVTLVTDAHSTYPSAERTAAAISQAVNEELAPHVTSVRAEEVSWS